MPTYCSQLVHHVYLFNMDAVHFTVTFALAFAFSIRINMIKAIVRLIFMRYFCDSVVIRWEIYFDNFILQSKKWKTRRAVNCHSYSVLLNLACGKKCLSTGLLHFCHFSPICWKILFITKQLYKAWGVFLIIS